MTTKARPHSDRGQGRKPTSPSGEAMEARKIRMTNEDWESAKLIGPEAIRAWIRKRGETLRAKAAKKVSAKKVKP